jgi:hypothetical protein
VPARAAIAFACHFRALALAFDSETLDLAGAASVEMTYLAAMISEPEIRDAVCGIAALPNAGAPRGLPDVASAPCRLWQGRSSW